MSSSVANPSIDESTVEPARAGWQELWSKEDWWAVWLGLGIAGLAAALFLTGSSISWIAVVPGKWSNFSQLGAQFVPNRWRYAGQFAGFVAVFTVATSFMGKKPGTFMASFAFIYVLSLVILIAGNWDQSQHYNIEAPLVALVLGLAISNIIGLPREGRNSVRPVSSLNRIDSIGFEAKKCSATESAL
jgi:hypothetical protein